MTFFRFLKWGVDTFFGTKKSPKPGRGSPLTLPRFLFRTGSPIESHISDQFLDGQAYRRGYFPTFRAGSLKTGPYFVV